MHIFEAVLDVIKYMHIRVLDAGSAKKATGCSPPSPFTAEVAFGRVSAHVGKPLTTAESNVLENSNSECCLSVVVSFARVPDAGQRACSLPEGLGDAGITQGPTVKLGLAALPQPCVISRFEYIV